MRVDLRITKDNTRIRVCHKVRLRFWKLEIVRVIPACSTREYGVPAVIYDYNMGLFEVVE
jgi:hypothetical protein